MIAPLETVAVALRVAAERGSFGGRMQDVNYLRRCACYATVEGIDAIAWLIFTRDIGHHSGGWFKNPDYERCYHLSVSLWDWESTIRDEAQPLPYRRKVGELIARAFFHPDDIAKIWIEPPYTPQGKKCDVYHYRLFCSAAWTPILPRAEVYTKEFTPRGWKSFSELHAAREESHP